jgi:hypothetical protein
MIAPKLPLPKGVPSFTICKRGARGDLLNNIYFNYETLNILSNSNLRLFFIPFSYES